MSLSVVARMVTGCSGSSLRASRNRSAPMQNRPPPSHPWSASWYVSHASVSEPVMVMVCCCSSTMQSTSPRIGRAFFELITRQMFFTAISSANFEIISFIVLLLFNSFEELTTALAYPRR